MLGLLLALGCPKPIEVVHTYEEVPRLPAPTAGSYNRSLEPTPDPLVQPLVEGLRWDASLAGAASGLALDLVKAGTTQVLTRWQVREAAWRAGWAYPIADARAWSAMEDGSPPPQLLGWLETVSPEDDLGLVRARGQEGDVWVALKARPRLDIGRVPRQLAQGAELALPALPGASYAISDANGRLLSGSLDEPVSLTVATRGEWLVQVDDARGSAALFPVYVGLVPPDLPVIEDARSVRTDVEAIARAEELLDIVRATYDAEPLHRDFMLDAGARSLLQGGGTTREGVIASLGLSPAETALWECQGVTVEACLDGMIWRPRNRSALLDDASGLGLAASVGAEGVRLVGILSRTD